MPMILRGSPMSPFARKVRMAILRLGLAEKVEFVRADPMNPEDVLRQDNPLGKIPVLITPDGKAIYDSRVILEYLDHAAGGGIIIPDGWPDAERMGRGRHFADAGVEERKSVRARHGVIHEGAGQELPGPGIVKALLQ